MTSVPQNRNVSDTHWHDCTSHWSDIIMTRTVCLTLTNYFSYQNCLSTTSLLREEKDKSPVQVSIRSCCVGHMNNVCHPGPRPKHVQLCHLNTFSDVISSLTHSTLVKLSRNDGRFHLGQSDSWSSFVYWGRDWDWVWCLVWGWVWVRGWGWDGHWLWTEIERELERELERRMSWAHSPTLTSTISKRHQIPTQQPRNSRFHSKQASDPTLCHCSLLPSADIACLQAAIPRLLHCSFT